MSIKIGIPRALLFHKYSTLWITFFEELGANVIVSEETNKRILNEGTNNSVDEACIPVKLFHGHVLSLKDKVDYIFIPRIVGLHKGEYICPKFSGLPEMIKYSLKDLPKIIDTEINFIKSIEKLNDTVQSIGRYVTNDNKKIMYAWEKAYENYKMDNLRLNEKFLDINLSNNKKIMVMGHPYNLYDRYMNMSAIDKIKSKGLNVVTPEMIDSVTINENSKKYKGKIFWAFARKLIGTTMYLIEKNNIDGVIYISSFGCGIDSVVGETVERIIRRESNIPYMLLTLDEHSGEAGVNTRLEAFIDMIKWREKDENNISAHG
ncbi:acyl-CoA dehydratase activase-related protein [Alkalithermobacter paradoxus]|uniref:2-hydroxyglutaryl-CoA dehydratase, D-component n=1 Tax=Alkalithermobacter paradoxus TaxID=29349 RepID=A0A1V4IBR7_9FIRM|nr:2-hydroxyglutaryl-CoA dehydratase, D-component [[Clostridium] thermoalcaliphilum]